MPKFPVDNFLSQIAEKFRRGTPWAFNKFGYRKKLCFRGLSHDIPQKRFCLTVPKIFAEETFYAVFQKNSGREKVYG